MFTVTLTAHGRADTKTLEAASLPEAAEACLRYIADRLDGTTWHAGTVRNRGGAIVARVGFNGREWLVDSTILTCTRCGRKE